MDREIVNNKILNIWSLTKTVKCQLIYAGQVHETLFKSLAIVFNTSKFADFFMMFVRVFQIFNA